MCPNVPYSIVPLLIMPDGFKDGDSCALINGLTKLCQCVLLTH